MHRYTYLLVLIVVSGGISACVAATGADSGNGDQPYDDDDVAGATAAQKIGPGGTYTRTLVTTAAGAWSLPICATPTVNCPAVGQTLTVELQGSGGGGGGGFHGTGAVGGHAGAGGGAGGYVKATYYIPTGVTSLSGVNGESAPMNGSAANSTASGMGFSSANTGYGSTTFNVTTSSGTTNVIRAFGGYGGSSGHQGGLGPSAAVLASNAGKYSIAAGATHVTHINGTPGVGGDAGATYPTCSQADAGNGGAGPVTGFNTTGNFGRGGLGGRGGGYIHLGCDLDPTAAYAGTTGYVRISWQIANDPGTSGSFDATPGNWTLPFCAVATSTCPGSGRLLRMQLYGAGAGGVHGQDQNSNLNDGGNGGGGGGAGSYISSTYLPPTTGVTSIEGDVGWAGSPSLFHGGWSTWGGDTNFKIVSGGNRYELLNARGGNDSFASWPGPVQTPLITAPPTGLGVLAPFATTITTNGAAGVGGTVGDISSGGAGGAGGAGYAGGYGRGGAGGNGAFHSSYGSTGGQYGQPGHIRITW